VHSVRPEGALLCRLRGLCAGEDAVQATCVVLATGLSEPLDTHDEEAA
jgi:hypothetical protein